MHPNKRILFGILCIAGMLAIISHSVLFGAGAMGEPPFVFEGRYFSGPAEYQGVAVYSYAVVDSVDADAGIIRFGNILGEEVSVGIGSEAAQGLGPGDQVFLSVVWHSREEGFSGEIIYNFRATGFRMGISAAALAAMLFAFRKRLWVNLRKLNIEVREDA